MKDKKGVTLVSVIIYVMVMLMIVSIVGTITSFFYSNSRNLETAVDSLNEFTKFNTHFLSEVKNKENNIESISNSEIKFTSGTSYKFVGDGIYENKVKLCSDVKKCEFSSYNQEEKTIIKVYLEIGNDFARNIEYVMGYDTITKVGQYEDNYTSHYADPSDGWNKNVVASVIQQGTRKVPIPAGYTASKVAGEDNIEDGLVIYEGTGEVNDSNHSDAMKNRNQYVWIPVDDINDMVMCQNHPNDKLDTETALCTTCEKSTPLVGKLYVNIENDSREPQLTFTSNSGYREPDVITGNNTGDGNEYDGASDAGHGLENATAFLGHLQTEFKNMAQSVAKYKGFYVSRYEIQDDAASVQDATVLSAKTAESWYGLYTTIQNSSTPDSTTPQMIWGCQYDQIMMFVDGKPDGSEAHTTFDVQNTNDATRKRSSRQASGNNPADLVCNIYDLENNYYEWTEEAFNTDRRIVRGGSFSNSYSTSRRNSLEPTYIHSDASSRATLYIAL